MQQGICASKAANWILRNPASGSAQGGHSMDEYLDKQKDLSADQMVKELRATFREEAYELLMELESALLELEKTPDDSEQVGRAFRAMHTIKGSGGACEFHDIVKFTHELETIF